MNLTFLIASSSLVIICLEGLAVVFVTPGAESLFCFHLTHQTQLSYLLFQFPQAE